MTVRRRTSESIRPSFLRTLVPTVSLLLAAAVPAAAPVTPGQEFDPTLSPWQRPISASAQVDPQGATAIDDSAGSDVMLQVTKWSYPIYYVSDPSTYTLEDVYLTENWNPVGHLMRNVPIPVGVPLKPDPTSDGLIAIVDTVHRMEWDFWAASRNPNGTWKRTWYQGRMLLTARTGDRYYLDGLGSSYIANSARGSGFALVPGLIRPAELRSGFIPHALALAIPSPASGGCVPPATNSDEESDSGYPFALPDGARIRLKPSVWTDTAIAAQPWTFVEKTIARALRDYGAFIADSTGPGQVALYAENPTYYPDPYQGISGMNINRWGGVDLFDPSFFSSANFEVVDMAPQVPVADLMADYDGDGIPNAAEIAFDYGDRYRNDPSNAQENPDGDPLTSLREWQVFDTWAFPTNPYRADSDLDGVDDAGEIVDGTDPTDPFSVNSNPAFAVGAFAVPDAGDPPLAVQWTAVVRGGTSPYSFQWDFGDGSPGSTLSNPAHDYATAGVYLATVTVTDATVAQVSAAAVVRVGQRTLTVTVSGTGTVSGPGISCPGDCVEDYTSGTAVTLTATPDPGWQFKSWSGACAGQGNPCRVTMNADLSATAAFTQQICPATAALEGAPQKEAQLGLLYDFRDEVLANTPTGQRYIKLFYKHALEGVGLMVRHPALRAHTRALLEHFLPTLNVIRAGKPAAMTYADLARVEALLEAFAARASPELQADLQAIQKELQQGAVLGEFGLTPPKR